MSQMSTTEVAADELVHRFICVVLSCCSGETCSGIVISSKGLRLSPTIPDHWDGYSASVRFGKSHWEIEVTRDKRPSLYVDGIAVPTSLLSSPTACHKVKLSIALPFIYCAQGV